MTAPLDQVLARAFAEDFTPEHPERRPWHQPRAAVDQVASTGNVVTVALEVADRVCLRNLDRRSWERDDLEPFDWTPAGWGVASP